VIDKQFLVFLLSISYEKNCSQLCLHIIRW